MRGEKEPALDGLAPTAFHLRSEFENRDHQGHAAATDVATPTCREVGNTCSSPVGVVERKTSAGSHRADDQCRNEGSGAKSGPGSQDIELWRPIAGLESRYEVSDRGRVRTLSTYRLRYRGLILKPWIQNKGYHYVSHRDTSTHRRICYAVHRLVLDAFVGPCPDGKQVAHGDGNPCNNHISNLRWATAKENIADRTMHGRTRFGEDNGSAKLDAGCVKTIKRLRSIGLSAYEIARLACVSPSTIQSIWEGTTWKHI